MEELLSVRRLESPRQFVHEVDKVTCPKPCPVNYEHFETPKVLDPAYQTMKGCLAPDRNVSEPEQTC